MSFENYNPQPFKILPDVVKNLLIINVLFFIGTFVFEKSFGLDRQTWASFFSCRKI
jgi:hypothetical protein